MKFELVIKEATIDELVDLLTSPAIPSSLRNAAAASMTGVNGDDDESGDTPAMAAPGTVDGSGLPWDDRIHSTPAKLTTKGVWRKRKGVDDATVSAVEAELRARSAPPQPQMQPQTTMPAPAPAAPAPQPVMQQPMPAPVPQPQMQPQTAMPAPAPTVTMAANPSAPVPQQALQPVAPPPQNTVDFAAFMSKVAQLVQAGLADSNYFAGLCQRIVAAYNNTVVVNSIADFQNQPAVMEYAIQVMASEGRWM